MTVRLKQSNIRRGVSRESQRTVVIPKSMDSEFGVQYPRPWTMPIEVGGDRDFGCTSSCYRFPA